MASLLPTPENQRRLVLLPKLRNIWTHARPCVTLAPSPNSATSGATLAPRPAKHWPMRRTPLKPA